MTRASVASLVALVLACSASSASAQWQTQDGGLFGARRCQTRNLMSGGLLLGAMGLPLLAHEDQTAAGVGVLVAGTAVALTGVALRIRLRGDPGRDGPHDIWPEDRCRARSLSIRGGVYLVTAIVGLVRLLRLPESSGPPAAKALAALLSVVPPALLGIVFTAIGLGRLRRLGPRPPAGPPEGAADLLDDAQSAPAFMLSLPIAF